MSSRTQLLGSALSIPPRIGLEPHTVDRTEPVCTPHTLWLLPALWKVPRLAAPAVVIQLLDSTFGC